MNLFVGIEEVLEKLVPLWRGLGKEPNSPSPSGLWEASNTRPLFPEPVLPHYAE